MTKVFNFFRFYIDLNKHRRARGIAWNRVAVRAGISPTGLGTFVRQFEEPNAPKNKGLSVENMVKLLDWMSKTDIAPYMVNEDDPDVMR